MGVMDALKNAMGGGSRLKEYDYKGNESRGTAIGRYESNGKSVSCKIAVAAADNNIVVESASGDPECLDILEDELNRRGVKPKR